MAFNRRGFLQYFAASGLSSTLFPGALFALHQQQEEAASITVEMIAEAEQIAGLEFTDEQRLLMLEDLNEQLDQIISMREEVLPNSVMPAVQLNLRAAGIEVPSVSISRTTWEPEETVLPDNEEDIAYLPVTKLSGLIKSRAISATDLTKLYLKRLKQYNPVLEAVVTLTEERALAQAAVLDKELAAGVWRGPLHGIPWGAKDLLAVSGYPTTWGAMPYKNQVLNTDATVVRQLDEAGAILVAKLTLGALAWGDVWYDGVTKNPWNIEQGASGSSAGPGAAVAAGLVGFAIGSETLGSIVSPSTRNGVTGHRPTYGRVSRDGAMALSWSMDKLGPMCRSAADCALVFDAIHGADPADSSSIAAAFTWPPKDLASIRVGYVPSAFEGTYNGQKADAATLAVLRKMGVELKEVTLPERDVQPLLMSLGVEAAAAFDEITRNGEVDTMVRQVRRAWPNAFRSARFVPAVEYVRANRYRTLLMQEMEAVMADVDVFVAPSFRGGALQITNLTGHPAVVVPNRFDKLADKPASPRRAPGSITFTGGLFKDDLTLAVAQAYQQETDFHLRKPPIR